MVQRQIVEYDRQLTVAQHLGVTLGGLRVVLQDGNDILRLHTEVLCQTAYLVLVLRNSQYNTSKCDGTELLLLFFRAALAALDRTGIRVARLAAALTALRLRSSRLGFFASPRLCALVGRFPPAPAADRSAGRFFVRFDSASPASAAFFAGRFLPVRTFFVRLGLPAPLGGASGLDRELFRRFGKALVALGELGDGLGKADVRDRQHRAARASDRAAKRVLIRSDAAPEALSRVGKVPHAAHAVFRGVGGDQNEPRVAPRAPVGSSPTASRLAFWARPMRFKSLSTAHHLPFQLVVKLRRDGGLQRPLQRAGLSRPLQALEVGTEVRAAPPAFLPLKSSEIPPSGERTTRISSRFSFLSRQPTHWRCGSFFHFLHGTASPPNYSSSL